MSMELNAADLISSGRRGALEEAARLAEDVEREASRVLPHHHNGQYEQRGYESAARKIARELRAKMVGDQSV